MTKNLTLALVIGGAALLTFLYVQRQAAAASITTAPVSVSPLSALVSGIGSFLGTLPLASGTASNSDALRGPISGQHRCDGRRHLRSAGHMTAFSSDVESGIGEALGWAIVGAVIALLFHKALLK